MADVSWRSRSTLEDHFSQHGRELGCRTIEEYDASAQETLRVGTFFTYYHDRAEEERVGCYDASSRRFVALTTDDRIVSHFACDAWYLRTLSYSTYDE